MGFERLHLETSAGRCRPSSWYSSVAPDRSCIDRTKNAAGAHDSRRVAQPTHNEAAVLGPFIILCHPERSEGSAFPNL